MILEMFCLDMTGGPTLRRLDMTTGQTRYWRRPSSSTRTGREATEAVSLLRSGNSFSLKTPLTMKSRSGGLYSGIEQTIYPLPYTERLVRFLKMRGLKLYYLSNYSEHLYKKTRQHMGFLEEFDGGLFSYEVLSIKPEEKIYRLLLDKYSIVPEKAIFFDDRQVNTEAASRLGIKGVVFEPGMAYHILDI